VKIVCQGVARHRILTELRLLPAGIRRLYPPRRVQSIYLDTHDGRALEQNLAGITDREKLRFRWYGDKAHRVNGALELKVRRNMLGWKERLELEDSVDAEGVNRARFVAQLAEKANPQWRERLEAGLEAAQWISYMREYYRSADGIVRITVDHDLKAFDQRYRATISRRFPTPVPNVTIIECKTSQDKYDALQEMLNTFPLVIDKCSKFVLSSDPGGGPLVSVFPD
jgi:SPX domain protein involved in polyphosphate accumulation